MVSLLATFLACDCGVPAEPLVPGVPPEAGFGRAGLNGGVRVTCVDGEIRLDEPREKYVAFWCAEGVCREDYVGRYYCVLATEFKAWRSACPSCDFVCEGALGDQSGGCLGDSNVLGMEQPSVCYRSCDTERPAPGDSADSADTSPG